MPTAVLGNLPLQHEVAEREVRHHDKGSALAHRPEGDAHPVLGLRVLDARLHSGDIVRLWTIPVSVSLASPSVPAADTFILRGAGPFA